MRELQVEEIQCKTILNKSTMPFSDYTLNAYLGCAFGCSYCYVPAMRQRRGQIDERTWGSWVQVKMNAPDVLRRQMQRIPMDKKIAIGTATDSWQPLDKKYGIARRILEELSYYPNPVSLLTRSPLLLRDIDILQRIPKVSVGVSMPTFDDSVRRKFEPCAPAIPSRIHLVRKLTEAGIPVTLFFCPVLYGVEDNTEAVRAYMERAAELRVRRVVWDILRYTEIVFKPHMMLLREYEQEHGIRAEKLPKPALAREIARWSRHFGVRCAA